MNSLNFLVNAKPSQSTTSIVRRQLIQDRCIHGLVRPVYRSMGRLKPSPIPILTTATLRVWMRIRWPRWNSWAKNIRPRVSNPTHTMLISTYVRMLTWLVTREIWQKWRNPTIRKSSVAVRIATSSRSITRITKLVSFSTTTTKARPRMSRPGMNYWTPRLH